MFDLDIVYKSNILHTHIPKHIPHQAHKHSARVHTHTHTRARTHAHTDTDRHKDIRTHARTGTINSRPLVHAQHDLQAQWQSDRDCQCMLQKDD